jgi:hypothetical protein
MYLYKSIKEIKPHTITENNKNISQITGVNIGVNIPTSCGSYSNALFGIIPSFFGKKYNEKYFAKNYKKITNRDMIKNIIKNNDKNEESYIYQLGTYSCCLEYEHTTFISKILNNIYKLFVSIFFPILKTQKYEFSGHAFTIMKYCKNKYLLTQTWIDEYDHTIYIEKKSLDEIMDIINKFDNLTNKIMIDDEFIDNLSFIGKIRLDNHKNMYKYDKKPFGMNLSYIKI